MNDCLRILIGVWLCVSGTPLLAQSHSNGTRMEQAAVWKDMEGNPINAHGAGVLHHDGMYYLFGEIKKGATWLVPGQSWEDFRVPAGGISCYASKDLVQWEYKGIALAPSTG